MPNIRNRIRNFFYISQFKPAFEKEYISFRYEQADPIFRFTFLIGVTITLMLTLGEWFFDGSLSTLRLVYLLFLLAALPKGSSSPKSTFKLFIIYYCVSVLFFIYQYYFLIQRIEFMVPIINLLATALIVSKIGVRISVYLGLFIPLAATVTFVISDEMNTVTIQLVFLLFLTSCVVWFSSVVLEKSSRSKFETLMELKTAKEKAAKESDARMNFLAFMSHEIRTPLNAILGYAESIVEKDIEPEEQQELVQRIHKNGDHLLHIVNNILDLSKIEQGKFVLHEEDTSLCALIQNVRFATENLAHQKGLEYLINCQFPLPRKIQTDSGRLAQILVNLIGNSIKFTKTGSLALSVSHKDGFLFFEVNDTGIGIGKQAEKRIFESFGQETVEIAHKYGGTGLGLAISKKLANEMGGDLTFTSTQGKGSTFRISIALANLQDVEWVDSFNNELSTPKPKPVKNRFTGNVLVADDISGNRKLLNIWLNNAGVSVDCVSNGKTAVEMALVKDYDLILMDIQMPIMDGIEALKQLQMCGNITPVIATTANVLDKDKQRYISLGFTGHLGKPIQRERLHALLQTYLAMQSSDVGSTSPTKDLEFLDLRARYLNVLKQSIRDIEKATEQKDWQRLQQLAHAIKGAASTFEFNGICDLASALESGAKNNDIEAIDFSNKLIKEIQNTHISS
jgi:signal transduction histidine kinase/CheY-like chemotaxis protein